MDKEMVSEAGKYLKDISSQGFETYVQGIQVTSITYASIGVLLLLVSVLMYFLGDIRLNKIDEKVHGYMTDDSLGLIVVSTWLFMILTFIVGLFMIGTNISGIVAPEYEAINRILERVGG